MNPTQNAAGTINCPKCQATNSAVARFCGVCGTPLQGAAQQQQQPPQMPPQMPPAQPPFTPPPQPQFTSPPQPQFTPPPPPQYTNRSMLAGASPMQSAVNADVRTAYDMVVQAIQAAGGEVLWQSPPNAAKFTIAKTGFGNKRGFWSRYDADVAVSPMGPRQSNIRINMKLQSGSMSAQVGSTLVACVFLAMQWSWFGVIIAVAAGGYQIYSLTNRTPQDLSNKILMNMGQAPLGVPMQYAPPVQTPQAPQQPPAMPEAAPVGGNGNNGWPTPAANGAGTHAAASAAASTSATVMEQLKQLGALRDAGVLTADEFDAKKSELLKRL